MSSSGSNDHGSSSNSVDSSLGSGVSTTCSGVDSLTSGVAGISSSVAGISSSVAGISAATGCVDCTSSTTGCCGITKDGVSTAASAWFWIFNALSAINVPTASSYPLQSSSPVFNKLFIAFERWSILHFIKSLSDPILLR